jgi:hypothetical protein
MAETRRLFKYTKRFEVTGFVVASGDFIDEVKDEVEDRLVGEWTNMVLKTKTGQFYEVQKQPDDVDVEYVSEVEEGLGSEDLE